MATCVYSPMQSRWETRHGWPLHFGEEPVIPALPGPLILSESTHDQISLSADFLFRGDLFSLHTLLLSQLNRTLWICWYSLWHLRGLTFDLFSLSPQLLGKSLKFQDSLCRSDSLRTHALLKEFKVPLLTRLYSHALTFSDQLHSKRKF